MDRRLSLGVNVSIIIILTIFTGLLVIPLKLLFNTNYDAQHNVSENTTETMEKVIEFRSLQLCPGDYKYWVTSTFISNYDRNCTYENTERSLKGMLSEATSFDGGRVNSTNFSIGGFRVIRPKSIPVTDHILAMMLIVSVIGALVELLRIRFSRSEDSRSDVGVLSRRQSIVDLMMPRRYVSREPVKAQMSLDMQRIHRSPLRMLATSKASCVPPLIRRSSFPTYFTLDGTVSDTSTPPRSPRRPSVTVDGETGVNTSVLHRRARLIRR